MSWCMFGKRLASHSTSRVVPCLLSQVVWKDSWRYLSHGSQDKQETLRATQETLRWATDMTNPASWYPAARSMKRKIILHIGPTNSGKTHQALAMLKRADSGVYCGPLRLLACEVADRLNGDAVRCNLLTGQEVRQLRGARHTACTVEMADMEREVEVAVVDEVQMLADRDRGHSWTRALLGLPARTLHLCGDPAVLTLVSELTAQCGDELEVRQYSRLSPLTVLARSLERLGRVEEGDCVVAFSRRLLHRLRRDIERHARTRACMVYGALPPDARRQQAALFNNPVSGHDVLVASDAIGMGLNLNIRRVVFTSLTKFDGQEMRPLRVSEVKQIAGRAGRFSSDHPTGFVTCLHDSDMEYLRHAMMAASEEPMQAGLFPRFEQLSMFADAAGCESFADAIAQFASSAQLSRHYFQGAGENMRRIATMLRDLDMPDEQVFTFATSPSDLDNRFVATSLRQPLLVQVFTFAMSPSDLDNRFVARALLSFATQYARDGSVTAHSIPHPHMKVPGNEAELRCLEDTWQVYDLFLWLHMRMRHAFHDHKVATKRREDCSELIEKGLARLAAEGGRAPKRKRTVQQHQEEQEVAQL